MRRPDKSKAAAFDPERFIEEAATTIADRPLSGRSKPPAEGFIRATFDIPEETHKRLRLAAAEVHRPMRELVLEGLVHVLDKHGA